MSELTPKEIEVIRQSVRDGGVPAKVVADRLGISQKTAQAHLDNARKKCGVNNMAGLVAEAFRRGVVTLLALLPSLDWVAEIARSGLIYGIIASVVSGGMSDADGAVRTRARWRSSVTRTVKRRNGGRIWFVGPDQTLTASAAGWARTADALVGRVL